MMSDDVYIYAILGQVHTFNAPHEVLVTNLSLVVGSRHRYPGSHSDQL